MKIFKADGQLKACFSSKEIASLLISKFFTQLFSAEKLKNEPYDSNVVSDYIKKLADHSVDSTDYEFFTSILDLYEQFEKNCEFCFNLKNTFNPNVNKITSIDDLYLYREDPPDVIVLYKNNFYEFELKRYRDEFTFDKLYTFLKKKIIMHYSGKSNFLVILQLKPNSNIDLNIFKELHKSLKKEINKPGIIGFSLNNNNEEMILVRILPELNMNKRPHSEINALADILHSEQ
ncbi:MAG: hypothetical protein Q8P87_00600 [bacterium]|nr:hypothetical protein [bacterium]